MEAIKLAFADREDRRADPRYMGKQRSPSCWIRLSERRAPHPPTARWSRGTDPRAAPSISAPPTAGQHGLVHPEQQPPSARARARTAARTSLDPASDNCLAGGKRSYHTIIPGFLLKDGAAVGPFGVMGAFMQPQGQTEVLVNTLDYHMNPQEALDAPRIQWIGGRRLELEREAGEAIADELRAMGHEVTVVDDRISMGRGQIIWRGEDGVYTAGTEPRCDGAVAAW